MVIIEVQAQADLPVTICGDAEIESTASAALFFMNHPHVGPTADWSKGLYGLRVVPRTGTFSPASPELWQFELHAHTDVVGAAAYHSVRDGCPYAKVFVEDMKLANYPWSIAFIHEWIEMMVNPYVNKYYGGPNGIIYQAEACDPCEGSPGQWIQTPSGVQIAVPEYVRKAYFGLDNSNSYSSLGHVPSAFTPAPGGRQSGFAPGTQVGSLDGDSLTTSVFRADFSAAAVAAIQAAAATPLILPDYDRLLPEGTPTQSASVVGQASGELSTESTAITTGYM